MDDPTTLPTLASALSRRHVIGRELAHGGTAAVNRACFVRRARWTDQVQARLGLE